MATQLDVPTLFDERARPFAVTWHKEAKEACVRRELGPVDRRPATLRGAVDISDSPEDRAARSKANSVHRARARCRVLAKANKICRLLTLTFAVAVHDREAVLGEMALFVRRLRAAMPRLRYLYVLELHPGGHGWHVHMGIDKYVDHAVWEELWGQGFVDIRYLKSKVTGYQQSAADVARYLAKYISKDVDGVEKGKRRFSGSHNLVDTVVQAWFLTLEDAVAWIASRQKVFWWGYLSVQGLYSMGKWSDTVVGWRGPECWIFR
jgi:hypothetical protein